MSTMSMARSTPAQNPRGAASQRVREAGVMGVGTLAHGSRGGHRSALRARARVPRGVRRAVGGEARAERVRRAGAQLGDAGLGPRLVLRRTEALARCAVGRERFG